MPEALDADAVRRWSRAAVAALAEHRAEIDALNVFPVPDSDTGSNLLTTVRAADTALAEALVRDAATAAPAALAALAGGAAQGALGNSGFIASQVLRGLADAAAAAGRWDADSLAAGLDVGATLARTAVVQPTEGTILSVARAAALGAQAGDLAERVMGAVRAADSALQRTPSQLPELAAAGVVDAGGRGLLVMLAALATVVTGAQPELTPIQVPAGAVRRQREMGAPQFAFEVQYLLDAPADAVVKLRHRLAEVGDSVAVVETGDGPAGSAANTAATTAASAGASTGASTWNVHAHVNDVGAAIEAGLEAGRPHQIAVVRFEDEPDPRGGGATVLAVAPGPGLAHLFQAEGVVVVEDGPEDLPTVADVVAAIRASGAGEVVLLPNATRVRGVAEAAAEQVRRAGVRASVVPTRSPVQGLAAIAVHDPERPFDDDVVAMAEAAAATRHAELVVAQDEALTAVGICQPGDVLGLIDGEVVEIGRGLLAVAFGLVDRILGVGAELMTIIVGADAPARAGELLAAHVRDRSPLTDVAVYQGGQPDQPVIIGVE